MRARYTKLDRFCEDRGESTIIEAYDANAIGQEMQRNRLLWQVAITMAALALKIIGRDPGRAEDDIREVLAKSEEAAAISEKLAKVRDKAGDSGRVYGSASRLYERRTQANGKFVFVESGVAYKEALEDVPSVKNYFASVQRKKWFLCDEPPEYYKEENNPGVGVKGVYLELPAKMEGRVSTQLPFQSEIGWFPLCEFAGVFDSGAVNSEGFPTLRLAAGWLRRPQPHSEIASTLWEFVKNNSVIKEKDVLSMGTFRKVKKPVPGDFRGEDMAARIALYYFLPAFCSANRMDFKDVTYLHEEVLKVMQQHQEDQLSQQLRRLYGDLG